MAAWRAPEALSKADWLTASRVRAYAAMLLAAMALALVALVATSHGGLDYRGRPLGTDFSNTHSAGELVLAGRAADAYSIAAQYAQQQRTFASQTVPFYNWQYPPLLLPVAAALALLPYLVALAVWQGATLALYLTAMWRILRRREAMLLALAYPAVFINLTHGHNGFLSAGLMGLALFCLERRPLLAGGLIACLAYKPQFGMLLPFALAAGGHWRAFGAAAATVLALAAASTLAFGVGIWGAFLDGLAFARASVLEDGIAGFEPMVTVLGAARLLGAPLTVAYGAQIASGLAALAIVVWGWRRPAPMACKAALLVACTLLATPYAMDYDLMLLALPIAWLAAAGLRDGFLPWERIGLLFVFALPLMSRSLAIHAGVPIAPLVIALLVALAARRVARA